MIPRTFEEALARFLTDPALGGVYRLAASRVAGLGEAEGLCLHPLPMPYRWTRETLLDALAESLAFPTYFGRNWDAAWDCLTELDWEKGSARVLLVPPAPTDGEAMATFLELLADACDHWAARGQTLAVLMVEHEAGAEDSEDDRRQEWLAALPRLPDFALGDLE